MRIYAASVVFWAAHTTKSLPLHSTSELHSTLDSFLDACTLILQQDQLFKFSNVCIVGIQSRILSDGLLFKELEKVITFENYVPESKALEQIG
jgi:hypothetical protein